MGVKCLKIWLFVLMSIAASATAFAQNSYPVHVTVQVLPPYGVYLTDYYGGTRDRLIITLLNRDQGQDVLQVKLRVNVKNGNSLTIRSRDELYYPVITLERGIPLRLTSSDIAPYLAPDRIAMSGYLENGKLPTGMTEFSVQAFDHATGRALSQVATGRAWLEIKQPPILDLPTKNEVVTLPTPQFLRFQWMPRHQGLASTLYEFTLRELPDNGAAPQSAFLYGNPVYQTQTRFSTINYTHLEPLLTSGKLYGWQVRAIAMDGVDEIGMFENNGYSEIGWFRLGDDCLPPVNVTAQAGYRKMTLQWQSLPEHTAFVVEYRPKSQHDFYEWTSTQTFAKEFIAYELTPGWAYEYRVGAMGGNSLQPVYSPVGELTLPMDDAERLAKCGMKPAVDLSNQDPKENLAAGDVVIIGGDFPMTLTQVSPQGSGWFSGKGWITMPWIFEVKVGVKFSRLRVNTDNYQIGGEVETETDPKASQIANLNELDYGGNRTSEAAKVIFVDVKLDFTLPESPNAEFDPKTGEVIIYDADGVPHVIATPENGIESIFPMVVEDDQGNQYQIDQPDTASDDDPEGKQKLVVTPIENIPATFDTSKLDPASGVVVQFRRGEGKYAFDDGAEQWYQTALLLREYYTPFGTYGGKQNYIAAWKLVPTGEKDEVEAYFEMGNADPDDVKFVLKDGQGVAAKSEGGTWTLTLPAVGSGETYDVFAVYKGSTVGKLNVVSYRKQQHTVTLVPVDARIDDQKALERELNSIYNPYGISITVGCDESIYDNIEWDTDGDRKLNLNGSGFFSNETDEMKALRRTYQQQEGYDEYSYYIFVMTDAVAGEEPDKQFAVQGDMPRGKQFGYVFLTHTGVGIGTLGRLIAHELGHGMFTLSHSFNVNYSGDSYKTKTANLMDYSSGTDLGAFQWNVIANPAPITWFDSDGDAMSLKFGAAHFIKWLKDNRNKQEYKKSMFTNVISNNDVEEITIDGTKFRILIYLNNQNGDVNLEQPIYDVVKSGNAHLEYRIEFKYADNDNVAIRLSSYYYDHFELLLKEIGRFISEDQQVKITSRIKQFLSEAGSDCNKLDLVYEGMPEFVSNSIRGKDNVYNHLKALNDCRMGDITNIGLVTNEQRAVINVLKSFDKNWLSSKINDAPSLFEEVLFKLSENRAAEYMHILIEIAQSAWTTDDYGDAELVLLEPTEYWKDEITGRSFSIASFCLTQLGVYEFGYIDVSDFLVAMPDVTGLKNKTRKYNALSPVIIETQGKKCILPAVCAKYLMRQAHKQSIKEFINLHLMVGFMIPAPTSVMQRASIARLSRVEGGITEGNIIAKGGNLLDDIEFANKIKDIKYLPGPQLPKEIAYSFKDALYVNRKLTINETFYKYHGIDNRSGKKYSWITNKKYNSELELRQNLAIKEEWGIQIEYVSEFNVPSGTWISEGKAASQGVGYPGGDYQAVITNMPNSWVVRTDKVFR